MKVQRLSVQFILFMHKNPSVFACYLECVFCSRSLLHAACLCPSSSFMLGFTHRDPSSKAASAPLFITHSVVLLDADGGLHSNAVFGKAHLLCRINKMFIHFMKPASCVVSLCIRLQYPISAREREKAFLCWKLNICKPLLQFKPQQNNFSLARTQEQASV